MKLLCANSLDALKNFEENSIDSLVTDPPAGISFMEKAFDTFDSLDHFQAEMKNIFTEVYRILKPGAYGLVWALPKTSHHTAMALEKAGFEVRDVITHLFGSGFPKNLNVSKAIDKKFGVERQIIGKKMEHNIKGSGKNSRLMISSGNRETIELDITKPTTPQAQQWDGWGTALKPASEFWVLVRKPLSEKTAANNVLKYGTGALNINGSRIPLNGGSKTKGGCKGSNQSLFNLKQNPEEDNSQGRFPSNLILSHNDDCEIEGGCYPVPATWKCTENCAVKMLDDQSGILKGPGNLKSVQCEESENICMSGENTKRICNLQKYHGQEGGASRFFYCAKASSRERNEGLEDMPDKDGGCLEGNIDLNNARKIGARPDLPPAKVKNNHPTIKSIKLMSYLIKLITPPNGTVLDCFMGSGSTGCACAQLGFNFIGIEKEKEYFEIAEKRIKYWSSEYENKK